MPLACRSEEYFNPQKQVYQKLSNIYQRLNELKTIDQNLVFALNELDLSKIILLNTTKKNPHIFVNIFWEHVEKKTKFYLIHFTSIRETNTVFNIYKRLFSNEILCVFGPKTLIWRLNGRIKFLPIETNLSKNEIIKRISKFYNYLLSDKNET